MNGKIVEGFTTKEEAIAKLVDRHRIFTQAQKNLHESSSHIEYIEDIESLVLDEHDVNSWIGFDLRLHFQDNVQLEDITTRHTIEVRGRGQILEEDTQLWGAGEYFSSLGIDYRFEINWAGDDNKTNSFFYDEETGLDSVGQKSSPLSLEDAKSNALLEAGLSDPKDAWRILNIKMVYSRISQPVIEVEI